ncbi:MAG: hypothetical protein Q8P97_00420, partial [bacterium]|nr:hypothetical protein [bacterium]
MSRVRKKIKRPKLREEILLMVKEDQAMRHRSKYDPTVDEKNTRRLKTIIKQYGWPTFSMVGKSGARGSWLLAQHADQDVQFQEYCLRLLEATEKKGEAEKKYIAYLTDRVLFNRKRPQIFGTQFHLNTKRKMVPWKIKSPRYLDKRRLSFGLDSFSKYRKQLLKL